MKSNRIWVVSAIAIVLIGLTSVVLGSLRSRQLLGEPGVKLLGKPILDEHGKPVGTNSVALPERVGGYWSTNMPVMDAELKDLPADTTFGKKRYYWSSGWIDWIDTTVVLMGTDRTSIHKPEICLTGQGWHPGPAELSSVTLRRPVSYDLDVTRLVGRKTIKIREQDVDLRAVYAYWFVSGSHLTASHRERFWISFKELIRTGVMTRWAYVSCFAVCEPGKESATYDRMKEFIRMAVPEFQLVAKPETSTLPPRAGVGR